ncbi:MAG: DUF2207 domain-containing protein, partial [Propionibacteriaceae bacterium]|nr:DUF2207 domain-containing protein [Propionibacteriaceae bacterium]
SVAPLELLIALGILIVGALALFLTHRRFGTDFASGNAIAVAEFHPIAEGQSEFRVMEGITPGLIGTVVDESVDPVDITATILDLAVRGYLEITELPRETPFSPPEWTFTRRDIDTESLYRYERTLLEAIAPVGSAATTVSDLTSSVPAVIGEVQSQLYDEVVAQDYFARRPDSIRNIWSRIGWIVLGLAVVATVLLAWLTSFGLTGLMLLVLALGVIFVAQEMPARTSKGAGMLRGLQLLTITLETQPTSQLLREREIEQVSLILPYAIVLGGWDRWLDALVSCDLNNEYVATDVSWYDAPADWRLKYLPDSLDNFITTVQGTLLER